MIKIKDLTKDFRLYHGGSPTLKSYVLSWTGRRRLWEGFSALSDIDLDIKPGEFFSVIGPNGSGKSTLLKILAGILIPTSGRVEVSGRLSPFLELGVGFQGELTGRENIYLYGAITGLTRAQIGRSFDEIVAFSELAKFIDTKLKHYSSGMQVRLAFATAIQTQAEVFLIDEVLAVGDTAFQRKCFEVFARFRQQGKTIVFVSHNLEAVRRFSDRAALLEKGRLVVAGRPDEVLERYIYGPLEDVERYQARIRHAGGDRWGSREVEITGVRLLGATGQPASQFPTGQPLTIECEYQINQPVPAPIFGLSIHRQDGSLLYGTNTEIEKYALAWPPKEGRGRLSFQVPSLPLLGGEYSLSVAVHDAAHRPYDWHNRLYRFGVIKDNEAEGEIDFQGRFGA